MKSIGHDLLRIQFTLMALIKGSPSADCNFPMGPVRPHAWRFCLRAALGSGCFLLPVTTPPPSFAGRCRHGHLGVGFPTPASCQGADIWVPPPPQRPCCTRLGPLPRAERASQWCAPPHTAFFAALRLFTHWFACLTPRLAQDVLQLLNSPFFPD